MRCNDDIRHGDKPCKDIVIDDVVGIVVEEDIGLFFIYIKAGSTDLTVLNALYKRLSAYQSASGSVNDDYGQWSEIISALSQSSSNETYSMPESAAGNLS